jgi:predicted TIM-barrel fold metal-dependent hydrolase
MQTDGGIAMRRIWLGLAVLLCHASGVGARGHYSGPIIDMHLHAASPDSFGGPQTVCTNAEGVEFPPVQPAVNATVQQTATCPHPLMSSADEADNIRRTASIMQRYNIFGVLHGGGGTVADGLARLQRWQAAAPGRFIPALDFGSLTDATPDGLAGLAAAGRIQLFGEISPQYDGELATAARLEPWFALAERLDIPVAIHLGEGPPGGAYVAPGSRYLAAAGRPLDLEPLLRRHPRLRVYVMHFGSPLVDEMIALMYAHPQVYVDVAQNDWGFPRAHFYNQLRRLVDAGFAARIMFGSDQMIWPDTIRVAIETIEQAPFLTDAQKRGIFYDNAARFLRLDEATRARHRAAARVQRPR